MFQFGSLIRLLKEDTVTDSLKWATYHFNHGSKSRYQSSSWSTRWHDASLHRSSRPLQLFFPGPKKIEKNYLKKTKILANARKQDFFFISTQ